MTWAKVLCLLLLVALAVTAVVQRKTIATVRSDNATLQQQNEQARQLARENAELPKLRAANQAVAALMEANQDLPKLRNEVRQLRQAKPEIEKLRAENSRLAAAIRSGTNTARSRLAQMDGYLAKETWSNAGFATPEAALQTFFWAAHQRNFQLVTECFAPEGRRSLEKEFAGDSDKQRARAFEEGFSPILRINGYRITGRQQVSEDQIVFGVQAAADGHVMQWPVQRIGNEWKIGEPK